MKAALVAFLAAGCTSAFGQFYPGPSPTASDAERVQRMLQLFGGKTGTWDEPIKWMGRNRMCSLAEAGWRGAAAERILGIFQKAAFLNPPHGFEVQTTVSGIGRGPLDFLTDDSDATGSHSGAFRVSLSLFPGTVREAGESGMHIIINVNVIAAASHAGGHTGTLARKPVVVDAKGPILRGAPGGAQPAGTFGGIPFNADRSMVLTKTAQPMYLPVSRERYLKAEIAGPSKALAARLEETLAAMSAAERALPAWIGCDGPAGLCGTADRLLKTACPLQTVNRAFFDLKAPAESMQLIVIRVAENRDPYANYLFQRIFETVDWNALLGLVRD